MTKKMTMGMIGSSTKENERRVAIHPAHFPLIDAESRKRVYVENGILHLVCAYAQSPGGRFTHREIQTVVERAI